MNKKRPSPKKQPSEDPVAKMLHQVFEKLDHAARPSRRKKLSLSEFVDLEERLVQGDPKAAAWAVANMKLLDRSVPSAQEQKEALEHMTNGELKQGLLRMVRGIEQAPSPFPNLQRANIFILREAARRIGEIG